MMAVPLSAETRLHSWPFGRGEAVKSEQYAVYVSVGTGPERRLDLVRSDALHLGDYRAKELIGRTFSFGAIDHDPKDGPLHFRVVKPNGSPATAVAVQPSRLGIRPTLSGGREARFTVTAAPCYLSVAFDSPDATTKPSRWIKHMLCLFVDRPEEPRDFLQGPGVVRYAPGLDAGSLASAKVIHFPPGYHDLRAYQAKGGPISAGILRLGSGQGLYLESGAFVDGLLESADHKADSGQFVRGRGILSGRHFPWYEVPGYKGPRYQQIVHLGQKARFEGVIVMESPAHGLVSGNRTVVRNVKYVGWHCNNDAMRFGPGSEVSECFIRAVDDFFYNFDLQVRDCVLWAGHNGAVLTYGWGGGPGSQTYRAGGSLLERIDIIHPEWTAMGNNNGIVASQTGFDFKPFGYGRETTTVLRDIRIDGVVPGLVNLKPRTGDVPAGFPPKVRPDELGYLGDLVMESVTVAGISARGIIRGETSAAIGSKAPYKVRNVRFVDLKVGGVPVGQAQAGRYFEIDHATTEGIEFVVAPPSGK